MDCGATSQSETTEVKFLPATLGGCEVTLCEAQEAPGCGAAVVVGSGDAGCVGMGAPDPDSLGDESECVELGCSRCWHDKDSVGSRKVSPQCESACGA